MVRTAWFGGAPPSAKLWLAAAATQDARPPARGSTMQQGLRMSIGSPGQWALFPCMHACHAMVSFGGGGGSARSVGHRLFGAAARPKARGRPNRHPPIHRQPHCLRQPPTTRRRWSHPASEGQPPHQQQPTTQPCSHPLPPIPSHSQSPPTPAQLCTTIMAVSAKPTCLGRKPPPNRMH